MSIESTEQVQRNFTELNVKFSGALIGATEGFVPSVPNDLRSICEKNRRELYATPSSEINSKLGIKENEEKAALESGLTGTPDPQKAKARTDLERYQQNRRDVFNTAQPLLSQSIGTVDALRNASDNERLESYKNTNGIAPTVSGTTTPSAASADAPGDSTRSTREPSPAQVAARENAKTAKKSYESTINSAISSSNAGLKSTLEENKNALQSLKPTDNIPEKLKTMAEGENKLATTDPERAALKQVQDARKNYASAAVNSTRTAARQEHIAGTSPFTTTAKKEQIFTDRTVGAVKNFVASRGRFSPLKAIVDKVNEAKSKADLKEAQEFLAAQVAVQRKEDPELAKVLNEVEAADQHEQSQEAGGSSQKGDPQEQEKARDMFAELQNNDIKYMTPQGSHRISYDKKTGIISSTNPEALAKFVSAQGWKDFKITKGSPENGLDLLNELHKEGVQDITFSPEMRSKISRVKGGDESVLIADSKRKAYLETSLEQQSERSLNALTYAKLSEDPNDEDAAKARKYLTKNIMTDSDRKDTLELLEAKVEKGEMTKEEFNAEAKSVLASSSDKEAVKSGLSDTTKAGMAPTPTLTAASTASAQPDAAPTAAASLSPTPPAPAPDASSVTTPSATVPTTPPAPHREQVEEKNAASAGLSESTVQIQANEMKNADAHQAQPKTPEAPNEHKSVEEKSTPLAQADTTNNAPIATNTAQAQIPSTAPTPAPGNTNATKTLNQSPQLNSAQAQEQAKTQTAAPNSPAPRPAWTETDTKECRTLMEKNPQNADKSKELAAKIGEKINGLKSGATNTKAQIQNQMIQGVKNFLKDEGKDSGTSFENFAAELSKQFPTMIPALMQKMTPPEVTKVAEKLEKDEHVAQSDTALKGIEENMPAWKKEPFGHPKSKSGSHDSKTTKENAAPPSSTSKEKTHSEEVKQTDSAVEKARKTIDEIKKSQHDPQKAQGQTQAPPSPTSPHRQ